MSQNGDDAQRAFEQRALRNVRALVEKAQREDRGGARFREGLKVLFLFVLVIGLAILLGIFVFGDPPHSAEKLRESELKGRAAQASLEMSTASYLSKPRRVFVDATASPPFAAYAQRTLNKIEAFTNANYPPEIRGIDGRVRLTMAIRFDGHIESVMVNTPSGNDVLDITAVRLVRLAEPYAPFPEELRREADVVDITRTFEFGLPGSTKAAISAL